MTVLCSHDLFSHINGKSSIFITVTELGPKIVSHIRVLFKKNNNKLDFAVAFITTSIYWLDIVFFCLFRTRHKHSKCSVFVIGIYIYNTEILRNMETILFVLLNVFTLHLLN